MTHTVGISNRTRYWQHYVFSHPPAGYRYARMADVPWHVLGVRNQFLAHTKWFPPILRADLYHTYNSVVANRAPWVVEVESYLPRYKPMPPSHPLYRWGLRRLASDDCKALIFTSQNTMRSQAPVLQAAGVDPQRMQVIYRAVEHYEPEGRAPDTFTVIFVGNGFYRKGGVELLRAFRLLRNKDLRLRIISSLEVDWGVEPTADVVAWTRYAIHRDPRITLLSGLSHDEVIRHMRAADLFVSTTFADPFNNTVLEAMGAGLPVISSEVSSIPEMVEDGRNGRLLAVEGRSSHDIAAELASLIERLSGDRALAEQWGRESHRIVSEKFSIEVRNARLKAVYDKALGLPLSA